MCDYSVIFNSDKWQTRCCSKTEEGPQARRSYISLFILCAWGLSAPSNEVKKSKKIRGVCIANGAPPVDHLFFADDNFLFRRAIINEWVHIQGLLGIYAEASGLILNHHKSTILFSSNTSKDSRNQILNISGVTLCSSKEKSLGLPSTVDKYNYMYFESIQKKSMDKSEQLEA